MLLLLPATNNYATVTVAAPLTSVCARIRRAALDSHTCSPRNDRLMKSCAAYNARLSQGRRGPTVTISPHDRAQSVQQLTWNVISGARYCFDDAISCWCCCRRKSCCGTPPGPVAARLDAGPGVLCSTYQKREAQRTHKWNNISSC